MNGGTERAVGGHRRGVGSDLGPDHGIPRVLGGREGTCDHIPGGEARDNDFPAH